MSCLLGGCLKYIHAGNCQTITGLLHVTCGLQPSSGGPMWLFGKQKSIKETC